MGLNGPFFPPNNIQDGSEKKLLFFSSGFASSSPFSFTFQAESGGNILIMMSDTLLYLNSFTFCFLGLSPHLARYEITSGDGLEGSQCSRAGNKFENLGELCCRFYVAHASPTCDDTKLSSTPADNHKVVKARRMRQNQ